MEDEEEIGRRILILQQMSCINVLVNVFTVGGIWCRAVLDNVQYMSLSSDVDAIYATYPDIPLIRGKNP